MRAGGWSLISAWVVTLAWAGPAWAQPKVEPGAGRPYLEDQGPLPERVEALLKAVGYHRSRFTRGSQPLVIGIAHAADTPPEAVARAREAFAAHQKLKLGGKAFTVVELTYKDPQDLKARLSEAGVGAVFLPAESRHIVRQVLNVTRAVKMLSFTSEPDYVHWMGVGLGVERSAQGLKPMVNLSGCQNEGVEFDSRLLRVAKVFF
jgi:hypothetical protein